MAKLRYDAWFGVGVKGGGFMALGGVEYVTGKLINVGLPTERHDFQMLSGRAGIGLGGSGGLVLCLAFNCMNLNDFNGKTQEDWGVNIAMGEKWSTFGSALKSNKILELARKTGRRMNLNLHDIEKVRNFMHVGYNIVDGITKDPKMLVIDIPGAGIGYELSANLTVGIMEILN